jgi:hypothetical protein
MVLAAEWKRKYDFPRNQSVIFVFKNPQEMYKDKSNHFKVRSSAAFYRF